MGEIANRRILIIALAVIGGVVAGYNIAQEDFTLAALLGGVIALWAASRLVDLHPDALIGGAVAIGYLVGNRGFAQLHPPGFPLLPGEAVLGVAVPLVFWRGAWQKTLPIRRDALNAAVLAWFAVGLARMPFDFRSFGFLAVRDFAIVYYALFFFVAQAWAEDSADRRWILGCLGVGLALSGPVFIAFDRNEPWFTSHLTITGIPIIFVKSDVAAGFMAGAALWFAQRCVASGRKAWLLVSAAAFIAVFVSNSRAAVIALLVGIGWLVILRAWKMLRIVAVFASIGLAALVVHAVVTPRPFPTTPLYRLYESTESMIDFSGTRVYQRADLSDKPDNNQFRLVWWRTVIGQTWDDGRWVGLGFGHDIAEEFFRVYYADVDDDFNVRSPHNFLLSVFARMGMVGFGLFAAVVALIARQTWRAGATRDEVGSPLPLWLTAWTILTAACFGVVLEGPMAAMVFWTALGLANGATWRPVGGTTSSSKAAEPAQLTTSG